MLSMGSDFIAAEKVVDIVVDREVMAGWRLVTRGTVSLGFDL